MAKAMKGRRARRNIKRQVPRTLNQPESHIRIRRSYAQGLVARFAADQGTEVGVNPTLIDKYAAFADQWMFWKLNKVTFHFILDGAQPATAVYPTLVIYRDPVSVGAPASLTVAASAPDVKYITFGANSTHKTYSYVPKQQLSTYALYGPTQWVPTTGATFVFSSIAFWAINYNTTVNTPQLYMVVDCDISWRTPKV